MSGKMVTKIMILLFGVGLSLAFPKPEETHHHLRVNHAEEHKETTTIKSTEPKNSTDESFTSHQSESETADEVNPTTTVPEEEEEQPEMPQSEDDDSHGPQFFPTGSFPSRFQSESFNQRRPNKENEEVEIHTAD